MSSDSKINYSDDEIFHIEILFKQSLMNIIEYYTVHYYRFVYEHDVSNKVIFDRNIDSNSKLHEALPNAIEWLEISNEKKSKILGQIIKGKSSDPIVLNSDIIDLVTDMRAYMLGCVNDVAKRILGILPIYYTENNNEFIIEVLSSLHVFIIPTEWDNMLPGDKKKWIKSYLINLGYPHMGVTQATAKYYCQLLPNKRVSNTINASKIKEDNAADEILNML